MTYDETKYYQTIPLVEKDTSPVSGNHGHLQLVKGLQSGQIVGTIRALQPIHVGTGHFVPPQTLGLEDDAPLVKSFHQVGDQLVIPGSSIKGPVRSLVEMITYSCVSKTRERLNKDRFGECRYNSRRHRGEICVACRLFGAMGYQGQVSFSDAPMTEGESGVHYIPPQYQPRSDGARRYYPHALKDQRAPTWPLHVATVGCRFQFRVRYQNLQRGELGLLLLALGQGDPPICLKIGAGKSSGLGSIRVEMLQVQGLDLEKLYQQYESDAVWQEVDMVACLAEAGPLLRRDALSRLQADLGCGQFEEA